MKLYKIGILSILLSFTTAALAESYKLEIIAFANLQNNTIEQLEPYYVGELEGITITPYVEGGEQQLSEDAEQALELPEGQFSMTAERNKLANSDKHEVILHTAWLQKMLRLNKKVYLASDNIQTETEQKPQFVATLAMKPAAKGLFQLSFDSTFHYIVDEQIKGYRLNKMLRVKPKEVYYLDHPAFGILLKLVVVQDQEPAKST